MDCQEVHTITILPGRDKNGCSEPFEAIDIRPGDMISIVGSTGSGKSAFINDIEVFAQGDTITKRTILLNGELPSEEITRDPAKKPVTQITQNTRCIADLKVSEFLALHIRARDTERYGIIEETISLTNEFTGEKVTGTMRMSSLSGGQTRSLFIADALSIGRTPILLLDEVENAGIYKEKVITRLKEFKKAVIFVTHDPYLALITDRRIVMKNGAVQDVIIPSGREQELIQKLSSLDSFYREVRERIRAGEQFPDAWIAPEIRRVTA